MNLIKKHWPTRNTPQSKRVFNSFLILLRFDRGLTYNDIFQIFRGAVNIDRWEFEDFMQEME